MEEKEEQGENRKDKEKENRMSLDIFLNSIPTYPFHNRFPFVNLEAFSLIEFLQVSVADAVKREKGGDLKSSAFRFSLLSFPPPTHNPSTCQTEFKSAL